MTAKKILVVEDEKRLAHLLRDYLVQAGYEVHCLYSGGPVVKWARTHLPDLILLDQMIPEIDGLSLLRELRAFSQVPVIIATARTEEIDRLLGLESGADDYVCKPFSFREVVARVKAVLRRGRARQRPAGESGLVLCSEDLTVSLGDETAELTAIEFKLLRVLSGSPGRIFSRNQLMDRIYEDNRVVSDRTIDSHIRKLRAKLSGLCPEKELICSVYSAGYKMPDVKLTPAV